MMELGLFGQRIGERLREAGEFEIGQRCKQVEDFRPKEEEFYTSKKLMKDLKSFYHLDEFFFD